jgi:hypothetical protein
LIINKIKKVIPWKRDDFNDCLPYEKKLNYLVSAGAAAAVVSTATAVVSTTGAAVSTAGASTAVVSAAGAVSEPPHDARATIAKIAKNFFILLGFLNVKIE